MEIRANGRDCQRLSRVKNAAGLPIASDGNALVPVIMYKSDKGELIEYLRGFKPVKVFMRYGYNRIAKSCPFRHRRCIGAKCALYFVDNRTGDCVLIWQMFRKL